MPSSETFSLKQRLFDSKPAYDAVELFEKLENQPNFKFFRQSHLIMVKASLYVGKSSLQAQLIKMLKTLAAEHIDDKVVSITSDLPEKLQQYGKGGYWLHPIGSYCLYLPESFFKPSNRRFFNKAFKTYEIFLNPIVHVQVQVAQGMKKDYDPERDGIRPLTRFSVICEISKKLALIFLVTDPRSDKDFFTQLQAKEFIKGYLAKPKEFSKTICRLHKIDNKSIFLLWNHELQKWEFVNLLFLVGREKMLRYKKGFDNRFAKPLMIVNQKNLNHEMTFTSNWTLEGSRQHYTMNRPNDMAIYQSIANKALKRAQEKFLSIHSERVTELILPESQVSGFFDYFEEIIQAVIMSYTTIESMANSCIPFGHEYTVFEKDGMKKTYTKELIERWLPLREKLKSVIPPIVSSASPTNEKWWASFRELEDLRNEIIHAKNSKAEIRYSMFLNEKVFNIVEVHNLVVSYYAKLFCNAKLYEMNQFPINVGCDELIPGLMTERDFIKSYKDLRNIK